MGNVGVPVYRALTKNRSTNQLAFGTEMTSKDNRLAFTNVNVVTLDARGILQDQTVVVAGDLIESIGPTASIATPLGAKEIRANGKFLIPGLCDMHVHIGLPLLEAGPDTIKREELFEDAAKELLLYLANGVTTVRNMAGAEFHRQLAHEVQTGKRPGPRIHTSSPILDGAPVSWPFAMQVSTDEEVTKCIRMARESGYESIKVYNRLTRNTYHRITAEAREQDLPVVGHVPFDVGLLGCLEARQISIEHFRGYDIGPSTDPAGQTWIERAETWLHLSDADLNRYTDATVEAETWNCPTFSVIQSAFRAARRPDTVVSDNFTDIPRSLRSRMLRHRAQLRPSTDTASMLKQALDVQHRFARMLHSANGRLLVGTDAGIADIIPGRSIHEELEWFVEAGLSSTQALQCCTGNPVRFYGDSVMPATILEGSVADIVLIEANPIADIHNTRRITGVMAAGRWFTLHELMDQLRFSRG